MSESWKDIPGYEGLYQASTLGRIRTAEGKTTSSKRFKQRRWKSRVMKGRGENKTTGYRVGLWKDGERKDYLVCRLVALTFLGEPQEGYTVNHIDGDRHNNKIENLEWLSLGDNIRHGFNTGLYNAMCDPVRLQGEDGCFEFRSCSQANKFLNRYEGYVSRALKGKPDGQDAICFSRDGKAYTVSRR